MSLMNEIIEVLQILRSSGDDFRSKLEPLRTAMKKPQQIIPSQLAKEFGISEEIATIVNGQLNDQVLRLRSIIETCIRLTSERNDEIEEAMSKMIETLKHIN